jgi:hypothetical protein
LNCSVLLPFHKSVALIDSQSNTDFRTVSVCEMLGDRALWIKDGDSGKRLFDAPSAWRCERQLDALALLRIGEPCIINWGAVRPINLSAPSPASRSIQLRRRLPWHAAGWFAVTATLLAQQSRDEMRARSSPYVPPAQTSTILAQVNLVEVPVVVRDSEDRAIAGLQRSDFEVFDAGKPKEIMSFSVEAVKGLVEPAASQAPTGRTGPPVPAAAAAEPPFEQFITSVDNESTDLDME